MKKKYTYIAGRITGLDPAEAWENFSLADELALRFLPKMHTGTVKKKQTISLTDMQTLAFWHLLNAYIDFFQPYEYALGCGIIEQIDKQFRQKATLRNSVRQLKIENKIQ